MVKDSVTSDVVRKEMQRGFFNTPRCPDRVYVEKTHPIISVLRYSRYDIPKFIDIVKYRPDLGMYELDKKTAEHVVGIIIKKL